MSIPTPHIAAKSGEIAPTVIICGDPQRAEYIAKNKLENIICYNSVRGMLGYTGSFKGKNISIQGHGMGMPSIGIYTYELYHFYDVQNIIRIGTAGSLDNNIYLMDVVLAMAACTDSNYASQFNLPGSFAPIADFQLLSKAVDAAKKMETDVKVGNVLSSDFFYNDSKADLEWNKMGVLCVEMEIAALYMNAARARKNALGILTITDELITGKKLTAAERQYTLNQMIDISLELAASV